jgi:mono/diheme cytochrome c family protein
MTSHPAPPMPSQPALHGLLAEYPSPQALLGAATRIREAGFKRWDTYSPFPVHGIDGAMGIKPTILPWLVFGAGVTGCAVGLLLQYWTNAVDYPWLISGKPFWSLPANIPIIFELTVLFSALTAVTGMLLLNNLPHPAHPLDLKERFARATNDRFFLLIEAADPKFDPSMTRALLDETAPVVIDDVHEDNASSPRLPRGLVYGLIVLAVAALVPIGLVAQARVTKSRQPRIHLVQDMDFQVKVKTQKSFHFFADGRGSRGAADGTIPREEALDEHLTRGLVDGAPSRTFPPSILPNRANMDAGRRTFDTYCAPCHGLAGNGDGMVAQRAEALAQGTWVPPSNLNQDYLRQQPVGQLFATISNGIRNMPPYGHLIPPEDRWRVLMYVRALQRRSAATIADVPPAQRRALE